MLSHKNLSSNAKVLKDFWHWQKGDVLLHALPIFHVHGLFVASHGALINGSKMIWLPKLDIAQLLKYLPQSTVMMGVPTFYTRLLAEPKFDAKVCANMRLFIAGSAPLLTETFNDFIARTGHTILERYGMSETAMLTSNSYSGKRVAGAVGVPLPGVKVRVITDDAKLCRVDEVGNVQVQGPNVFSGYWQMPEKTKEEFTADGWFKTGDVGRWGGSTTAGPVPDDYLCIVGRSKDLIISGGYNIYPKEIESFIDEMDGVEESAVIGIPHPDFGEAVLAVVVPKKGAELDPVQIIAELKGKIANFKVPKKVIVVAELPRNAMGKVQKNILRQEYTPS
jgi:malonyl-CoA/methylmalonyl-CoA synthetase